MRLLCAASVVILIGASAPQSPPSPVPQTQGPLAAFRTGVDLIQLDVVVLDKNRRPVSGLTAGDFTVQLDGKPSPIEAFAAITLPDSARGGGTGGAAAWTRDVPSDVATNQRSGEGRMVVIMMDRTIPAGPPTRTAQAIARAAVETLGPMDIAAVVRTSGIAREGLSQGFTADKARLRAAIDAPFMGQTAPPSMKGGGLDYGPPEQSGTGDCPDGSCVLEAIRRVAETMTVVTGRQKSILFIGADMIMPDSVATFSALKEPYEKAVRALDRANVTLHTIDPSGLESLALGFTPTGKPTAPYSRQDNLKRQGNLAVLPDVTGGRAVANTNAPQDAVPQIFDEARAYYLLGIRRTDGKTEVAGRGEVRIRVNRADVTVRSRRGYDPTPASPVQRTPGDVLEHAIAPLLPRDAMPLEMGLLPIFQATGEPAVQLLIRIGASPGLPDGAVPPWTGPYDVLVGVFDMGGRKVASVRESIAADANGAGLEWMSYFPMKPGRYEVRVGILPRAGATASSVYGYVDVPEMKPGVLTMSGVRFEAALDSGRTQPTLRRRFTARDRIDAFVQLRRWADNDSPVAVRVQVVDDRGVTVAETRADLKDGAFLSDVAEYRYPLRLSELRPGRYLLRIEVGSTDRREIPFGVIAENEQRLGSIAPRLPHASAVREALHSPLVVAVVGQ